MPRALLLTLFALAARLAALYGQASFALQILPNDTLISTFSKAIECTNGDLVMIDFTVDGDDPEQKRILFKRFSAESVLLQTHDHLYVGSMPFGITDAIELGDGSFALSGYYHGLYINLAEDGTLISAESLLWGVSTTFNGVALMNDSVLAFGGQGYDGTGLPLVVLMRANGTLLDAWSDHRTSPNGANWWVRPSHDHGLLTLGTDQGQPYPRLQLEKVDSTGAVQWARQVPGETIYARDALELASGSWSILGLRKQPGSAYVAPVLIKFSAQGDLLASNWVHLDSTMAQGWEANNLVLRGDTEVMIVGHMSGGHDVLMTADTNGVINTTATLLPTLGGVSAGGYATALNNGDLLLNGEWYAGLGYSGRTLIRVPADEEFPCPADTLALFIDPLPLEVDSAYERTIPNISITDITTSFVSDEIEWTTAVLCPHVGVASADPMADHLIISPNPASNSGRVQYPADAIAVNMLNAQGQLIRSWSLPLPAELRTVDLPPGPYIVNVITATGPVQQRLVVEH